MRHGPRCTSCGSDLCPGCGTDAGKYDSQPFFIGGTRDLHPPDCTCPECAK